MGYRTPTKKEKARFDRMSQLGCIICLWDEIYTPPAIHHIDGKTKPGCHQKTIPLCGNHHQIKDNQKPPRWVSLHGDGRKAFRNAYFYTEMELLEKVNGLLND